MPLFISIFLVIVGIILLVRVGPLSTTTQQIQCEIKIKDLKLKAKEQVTSGTFHEILKHTKPLKRSNLKLLLNLYKPNYFFVDNKIGVEILGGDLELERSDTVTNYLPESWTEDIGPISVHLNPGSALAISDKVQAAMKLSRNVREGFWRFDIGKSQSRVYTTYNLPGNKHFSVSVMLSTTKPKFFSKQWIEITAETGEIIRVEPDSVKLNLWIAKGMFVLALISFAPILERIIQPCWEFIYQQWAIFRFIRRKKEQSRH